MGNWYDEEMPGQECPYSRDHRIMMENYFEGVETSNNQQAKKVSVEPNSIWQHHNGITYQVLHIANEDSTNPDYPETIVYKGFNGKVWAKLTENFLSKMSKIDYKRNL